MGITVMSPSGHNIEFPDGTDADTIRRTMMQAEGKAMPQKPAVGTIEALGRGALQGATFGLSDEIYAGAKGAYDAVTGGSFSDTYNRELTDVRAANARAKESNPIPFIGGEIAGGFALPAGAVGTAARTASRGARLMTGAKTGAAYGAAYGFGQAEGGEGTLAEQFGNRAASALPSALVGGVVGAVAPAAIDVGSAIVRGATNPIRAAVNPVGTARTKVAEALLRDAPEGVAIDDVVAQAGRRLARTQATKPDAILADVGGQNSRDLLRAAANMPSQGAERLKNSLDRRQSHQWSRIEKDVADTLADGNKYDDVLDTWKGIVSNVGRVAFERAYQQPFNIKAGDDLARFLTERGYVRRLLEKTDESVSGMTGENTAQMKPWELLHRVKIQMDTEIRRLKSGQGDAKANWTLSDLVNLKREMVDLMGKANPEFRKAMLRYGDVAGARTALERGADEFKAANPSEIASALKSMNAHEKKMYRLGAARSLFADIERGNVMRDRTESIFSSPEIAKKLAALFPDTASRRDFQRRLVIEARMADTRKAVQGGSTTARQLAQGQEAGQPVAAVEAVANLGAGRFGAALGYLSRQVQAFSGMTPSVADQIIKEMMEKGALGSQVGIQMAVERAAKEPEFRAQLVRKVLAGASAGRDEGGRQEPPNQSRGL